MKRKFVNSLINSVVGIIILVYLFSTMEKSKFVLIPFFICSVALFLKNLFILTQKPKYIKISEKIFVFGFLLFWFGFVGYWCYINFINKDYVYLLFSIPFWVVGILFTMKKIKNQ